MNSDQLVVFVRIALYMVTGRALAGGWIPQEVADQVTDPATVELIASMLFGAGVLAWYWVSKSRKVLKAAI